MLSGHVLLPCTSAPLCLPPPMLVNVRMHLVRHERAISPFLFVKFESYALAIVDGRACGASREDVW